MNAEIRQTFSSKGKGLFATINIPSGTVIIEEDPLVSCQFSWNSTYHYRACDHCLRPLETAEENASRLRGKSIILPYSECCTTDKSKIALCPQCKVEYCSLECKDEAFSKYHKILCIQTLERDNIHPLEVLNEAWKHIHYPPETSSIMLIVRLLARILQAPDKEFAVAQTLQFCHRTVNEDADLAHKLLGEKFADQLTQLHSLLQHAIPHDGIQQFLTLNGFQSLLALIGTNGQGIGTSPLSQWVNKTTELPLADEEKESLDKFIDNLYNEIEINSGTFLNNEGVGLYVMQSACNHSCAPNAEPSFLHNNHRLSLVALRDIKEGEEIFISYLDDCMLGRSRHSRRKELMANYLFLCDCPKCVEQADEPDITSDEDDSMSE